MKILKKNIFRGIVLVTLTVVATTVFAQQRFSLSYHSSAPIEKPILFGIGIFSTEHYDLTPTFAPDGKSAYFTVSTPAYGKLHTILVSEFRNGKWSAPEIAAFSGEWSDADPFVSPDGQKVYFISNRPGGRAASRRDYDIYVVEKNGEKWGEPTNLGTPVNSEANELYVTVTKDGTIYFVTARSDSKGQGDIYRSKLTDGRYKKAENLGDAINSPMHDTTPYISPEESYLIYASGNRDDGQGDLDLYISYRKDDQWTKAKNLEAKINSKDRDYCPLVSPDGKYLFFSSDRGFNPPAANRRLTYQNLIKQFKSPENGLGNVYQVDVSSFLTK
jgi:Tol biopolymer transport system component